MEQLNPSTPAAPSQPLVIGLAVAIVVLLAGATAGLVSGGEDSDVSLGDGAGGALPSDQLPSDQLPSEQSPSDRPADPTDIATITAPPTRRPDATEPSDIVTPTPAVPPPEDPSPPTEPGVAAPTPPPPAGQPNPNVPADADVAAPNPPAPDGQAPDPAAPAPPAGDQPAQNAPANPDPPQGQPAPAPPAANNAGQMTLPVGTCVSVSATADHVGSVTPVDCNTEHTGEVYVSVTLPQGPGATYPGGQALFEEGRLLCQGPGYGAYVGREFSDDDRFFVLPLFPTEATWAAGDREMSCYLYDIAGPRTRSVRE